MIGKMQSGKTYTTNILLSTAPKSNVFILDSHNEYVSFPMENREFATRGQHTPTRINDFLKKAYTFSHRAVVIDDIDLYIKHDRESEQLAEFLIDSRHNELAGILLAKRAANLDLRIMQASRYVFLFRGVIAKDIMKIAEHVQIEPNELLEAYIAKVAYISDDEREHKIDTQHPFFIIDTLLKTVSYRTTLKLSK